MKKTIITLLALAGVAAAGDYTTSNSDDTTVGGLFYNGFAITLASNTNFTNSSVVADAIGDNELVWLDSVTQHYGIRELKGATGLNLTLVDANRVVQAISTNSVTSTAATDFSWTFSGVKVNPNEVLYFVYTATDNTEITLGSTLEAKNGHGTWTGGYDMIGAGCTKNVNYSASTIPGNGVLGSNQGSNLNVNTNFMPILTITTSKIAAVAVPEPTTATLSLLALAGLAARRRRK